MHNSEQIKMGRFSRRTTWVDRLPAFFQGNANKEARAQSPASMPNSPHGDEIGSVFRYRAGNISVLVEGVIFNSDTLLHSLRLNRDAVMNPAQLLYHCYRHWGKNYPEQIKGHFAIVLIDSDKEFAHCLCDRLGITPLFYAHARTGELLIATGVSALASHPEVSTTINRQVFFDLLSTRWPNNDETFYTGVSRLPPAHILEVTRNGVDTRCYWDPHEPASREEWATEEEVSHFDDLLEQAVERCLIYGKAGISLSGGLDSVSVAAVATDLSGHLKRPPPAAYSVVFPHPDCNEEFTQRNVANQLGIDVQMLTFEEALGGNSLIQASLKESSTMPEPIDNVWQPLYAALYRKAAAQGTQVMLTGSGGDEWLTVTPRFSADMIAALHFPGVFKHMQAAYRSYRLPLPALMRNWLWKNGMRPLLVSKAESLFEASYPAILERIRRKRLCSSRSDWLMLHGDDLERTFKRHSYVPRDRRFSHYFRDIRRGLDHTAICFEMDYFYRQGKRSGIQVMHPFWDADFVDLLYRVHPDNLICDGRSKGLIRNAVARRFPSLKFERQKKVVSTQFYRDSIIQNIGSVDKDTLELEALAELKVVNRELAKKFISNLSSSSDPRAPHLAFTLLNFETWARSQHDNVR